MPDAEAKSSKILIEVPGRVEVTTATNSGDEASIEYTNVFFSLQSGLDAIINLLAHNPIIVLNSEKSGDLLADGKPVKKLALFRELRSVMKIEDSK